VRLSAGQIHGSPRSGNGGRFRPWWPSCWLVRAKLGCPIPKLPLLFRLQV